MFLSELFSYIATIDSASIDLDTDGDGIIATDNYTQVINAINLGLTDLYKEFPIKEKVMVVQLYAHITDYLLTRDFAETNDSSTQPYKYIMDTTFDPFYDDIITILSISNEGGQEYPINQNNQLYSMYLPQFNLVQHPFPDDENAIFIGYRAKHVTIATDATPATQVVDIPASLLSLLLLYVTHKLLAGINREDSIAKLQEYTTLLLHTQAIGVFVAESSSNEKFDNNGWV